MIKKINPKQLTKPLGSYSQGTAVDIDRMRLLFITGQVALNSKGNIVGKNNITKQSDQVFKNIAIILTEAGGNFSNVVKVTNLITDIKLYPKFSRIRNKYLKNSLPASSLFEVPKLFKEGLLIEVEAIAIIPK